MNITTHGNITRSQSNNSKTRSASNNRKSPNLNNSYNKKDQSFLNDLDNHLSCYTSKKVDFNRKISIYF